MLIKLKLQIEKLKSNLLLKFCCKSRFWLKSLEQFLMFFSFELFKVLGLILKAVDLKIKAAS